MLWLSYCICLFLLPIHRYAKMCIEKVWKPRHFENTDEKGMPSKRLDSCTFSMHVLINFVKINQSFDLHCIIQGAKEVIFKACHSGKLRLAYTSPNIISTSPKTFWWAELISQFFCNLNSTKNSTFTLGKLRTAFTSPIAKSTCPRLSDASFFGRWQYPPVFYTYISFLTLDRYISDL